MKESRIRILRDKARKKVSKEIPNHSFKECHNSFYGYPYIWEKDKNPLNSDNEVLRALYFGYRYGKKLTTKDQAIMSIDSAFEVFREMFDEFKSDLAKEISQE